MSKSMKQHTIIYISLLLIYLTINSLLPYNIYIPKIIRSLLGVSFLLSGTILLFLKLLINKNRPKSANTILLFLFIIVHVASSICMMKYGVVDNIKTTIWMCIMYSLLYDCKETFTKKEQKKFINKVYPIISLIWCFAIFIGIYQFINHIGYTVHSDEFVINKAQGLYYNRLFGIFMDPNYAAAISAMLLLTSIYMIKQKSKFNNKILNIFNAIIQFTYIILSGSRTGLLMLCIGIMINILLYIKKSYNINKDKVNFINKIIVITLICSLIVPIVLMIRVERQDLSNKSDSSNLRFSLWADSIKIWKSKPILGTSSRNFNAYSKDLFLNTLPGRGYSCGNGFLSVLIYTGIIGVFIIGIFFIKNIIICCKYFCKHKEYDNLDILLVSTLCVILLEAGLNEQIFFINSLNTSIFWLYLGFIINNATAETKKKSNLEKVGVVTIHDADNYGSALQAYATQLAIEKIGYDAYIIDHKCKKISKEYGIRRIFSQKKPKKILENFIRVIVLFRVRTKFKKFRKNYFKLKGKDINQQEFKKFVIGSDQVWNYKITNMDKDYFLDFVEDDNKKIAYSSSFGISNIPVDLKEEYSQYLKKFQNIAVREHQASKIIKDLIGIDAPVVLDPTLLITSDEWSSISNMPYNEKNYIVCYQIAHSKTLVKFAEQLAKKTNKKLISIQGSLRQKFDAKYIWDAGPLEYIGLIKNADYVVTNSFHGTAFSINLNKLFFTELLPTSEKTNSRLENILKKFNLTNRKIVNGKNDNIFEDIDYKKINKLLEKERKQSISILKKYIKEK